MLELKIAESDMPSHFRLATESVGYISPKYPALYTLSKQLQQLILHLHSFASSSSSSSSPFFPISPRWISDYIDNK